MGMSYQTKLAKAFYNYQNKAQGFQVKISGTEVKTMLIEMVEDKYQNTHYVVKNAGDRASPERALQQSPFEHFLKTDVKGPFCISVMFYDFVVS